MGDVLPTRGNVFTFLNNVREGGKHNMFEGPKMIAEVFDCSPEEAKTYFFEWTQSLDRSENG